MIDVTGTGNTVNMDHPKSIQMVMDSLRYWVRDMGVDGFRFDLAATLGRFATGFSPMHPLLIAMATDDILARTKLIADLGRRPRRLANRQLSRSILRVERPLPWCLA